MMNKMPRKLCFNDFVSPVEAFHLAGNELKQVDQEGHCHDFYECFLVTEGECWHTLNGERSRLKPGKMVFLRPEDIHGFQPLRKFIIFNLAFSEASFTAIRDLVPQEIEIVWPGNRPVVLSLDTRQLKNLKGLFSDLGQGVYNRVSLFRFLLGMLQVLNRPEPVDCPDWLAEALLQIQEPDEFRKGVQGFVGLCYRSQEHVSRVCREKLGQGISDIVNEARMVHAGRCLGLGNQEILDISLECGFKSLAQFYKVFKLKFGMTPRQYRLARMHTLV